MAVAGTSSAVMVPREVPASPADAMVSVGVGSTRQETNVPNPPPDLQKIYKEAPKLVEALRATGLYNNVSDEKLLQDFAVLFLLAGGNISLVENLITRLKDKKNTDTWDCYLQCASNLGKMEMFGLGYDEAVKGLAKLLGVSALTGIPQPSSNETLKVSRDFYKGFGKHISNELKNVGIDQFDQVARNLIATIVFNGGQGRDQDMSGDKVTGAVNGFIGKFASQNGRFYFLSGKDIPDSICARDWLMNAGKCKMPPLMEKYYKEKAAEKLGVEETSDSEDLWKEILAMFLSDLTTYCGLEDKVILKEAYHKKGWGSLKFWELGKEKILQQTLNEIMLLEKGLTAQVNPSVKLSESTGEEELKKFGGKYSFDKDNKILTVEGEMTENELKELKKIFKKDSGTLDTLKRMSIPWSPEKKLVETGKIYASIYKSLDDKKSASSLSIQETPIWGEVDKPTTLKKYEDQAKVVEAIKNVCPDYEAIKDSLSPATKAIIAKVVDQYLSGGWGSKSEKEKEALIAVAFYKALQPTSKTDERSNEEISRAYQDFLMKNSPQQQ